MGVGTKVAVKRMLKPDANFKDESDMLSRIHHRRIVRFLGFCDDRSKRLCSDLVFEYMKNGSLYDVLHRRSGEDAILSLEQRLKIARDVAQGLEYLRHGAGPSVIHRDVKSANVMMDSNLSAKLTDFGAFKQGHENTFSIDDPIETDNYKGTYYYIDPIYGSDLTQSTKSDVYSFGMLLIELVTGQKAIAVHGLIFNAADTSTMTINSEPELLLDIVDPFMKVDSASDAEALKMVNSLACRCLQLERESRPSMFEVVRVLGPGESCGQSADDQISTISFTSTSAAGGRSSEVSFNIDSSASTVQESFVSQGR